MVGRQKLADAQTGWRLIPPPAPLLGGTKRGTSNMRIPVSGTRYPDEPTLVSYRRFLFGATETLLSFLSYSKSAKIIVPKALLRIERSEVLR